MVGFFTAVQMVATLSPPWFIRKANPYHVFQDLQWRMLITHLGGNYIAGPHLIPSVFSHPAGPLRSNPRT